ncbi:MAG TPA: TonB-dependent receptor plug domain-containing protein, partial [Mucilaginibacter sp.]|nr:TonB-dependent receptor plug domain-containing protein [Mucilaginibacter sp.]
DSTISIPLPAKKTLSAQPAKIPPNGRSKLLKEVVIKAQKPILERSSNLNGPGNADQVLLFKNMKLACPSIAECMIGKLTGVFFLYDPEHFVYYPVTYESGKAVAMKIMVDGIIVDAETLNTIPPEIVESAEVLRSASYTSVYGNDGYNGLILINTKRGGDFNDPAVTNVRTHTMVGYHKSRVFYSPKYDHPKADSEQPDQRSTVYWNPNIVTDKDGKASFEYYNSDGKGTYRLIVEGIDENGKIGRAVYRYKVE